MALGYILGGGANRVNSQLASELHDNHPVVRELYQNVQEWTGLSLSLLLTDEVAARQDFRERFDIEGVRQAAMVVGIADILAEHGIRPTVISGISLGGLIGGCLAGSVRRDDLFRLLAAALTIPKPPPGAPAQGTAIATVPIDQDPMELFVGRYEGVYLAIEIGPINGETARMVVLSGYRENLMKLSAAVERPVTVNVIAEVPMSMHCPLRQYAADFMAPHIDAIEFRDPDIPLCSSLEPRTLTKAAEVRTVYQRNFTSFVSMPYMRSELARHGTQLAFVLGPSQFDRFVGLPFPVVYVETPEHLMDALSAVYEFGIDVGQHERQLS